MNITLIIREGSQNNGTGLRQNMLHLLRLARPEVMVCKGNHTKVTKKWIGWGRRLQCRHLQEDLCSKAHLHSLQQAEGRRTDLSVSTKAKATAVRGASAPRLACCSRTRYPYRFREHLVYLGVSASTNASLYIWIKASGFLLTLSRWETWAQRMEVPSPGPDLEQWLKYVC